MYFALLATLVFIPFELPGDSAADASQHVIVAVGAPGTQEYGNQFQAWAKRWQDAAANADCSFASVGRKKTDTQTTDADQLQTELSRQAGIETSEALWLVLIGHGTFDGRVARFNLQGPDIAADELKEALQPAKRPVVIINCSSCSAPFINALSGPNRIVVTATKDGSEIQFARFGDAMSQAIGDLAADIDRDGQTSLLEAWLFAANRTAQFYESDGRLATEHSLLDDSGDGKGTRAEVFEGTRIKGTIREKQEVDGRVAQRIHLVRSDEERRLSPDQRVLRDRLEQQLAELRTRRKEYETEAKYLQALETALLPLAKLYRSVDDGRQSGSAKDPASKADLNTPTDKKAAR